MKEKKTSINFKIVFGALLVVIVVLCGVVFFKNSVFSDKKDSDVVDVDSDKDLKKDKASSEKASDSQKTEKTAKCYGTYKHDNITFTLKSDGTFETDFFGASGTTGVFSINDNTVSLTGHKDTVGPREEDPYYHTDDYVISDDCSYILYTEYGSTDFTKLVSEDAKKGTGIQRKVKCEGIYRVDDITFTLKSDGTFLADFSGTSGTEGVFSINDNTVSFSGRKHTVGPRELDPYYDSVDYVIADDCSKIEYRAGDIQKTLIKE